MIKFDIELSEPERTQLMETDPKAWFTKVAFANVESPIHPQASFLDKNNVMKQRLAQDWVEKVAPGAKVLDTFCANGAFSFLSGKAGAASVVGVDFEQERIDAANLVVSMLDAHRARPCALEFRQLDIYDVARQFDGQTFDVSLVLGGLYHIADPPHILRQIRAITGRWMILQTSNVLPDRDNVACFKVRSDYTGSGFSSIRGGNGVWHYSVPCLREIISHGGFEIVDERRPDRKDRKEFPWYCALTRPRT